MNFWINPNAFISSGGVRSCTLCPLWFWHEGEISQKLVTKAANKYFIFTAKSWTILLGQLVACQFKEILWHIFPTTFPDSWIIHGVRVGMRFCIMQKLYILSNINYIFLNRRSWVPMVYFYPMNSIGVGVSRVIFIVSNGVVLAGVRSAKIMFVERWPLPVGNICVSERSSQDGRFTTGFWLTGYSTP